jgi:hypothetical protein
MPPQRKMQSGCRKESALAIYPALRAAIFLSEYTFENYNDTPHGPQIRIPLEEALRGFAVGEYRLTWQSIGSFSESITFEWDGKAITSVLDQ